MSESQGEGKLHLIILNSRYWDRSIEAVYQTLRENSKDAISKYDFKFLKLPEQFSELKSFVVESDLDSISIIGSLREWDSNNCALGIQEYLSEMLIRFQGPRVWVMCFDLHHEIGDLLIGKKSKGSPVSYDGNGKDLEISKLFDILAWPYEHLKDDFDGLDVFANNEQALSAQEQTSLVLSNHKFLQEAFAHRIDFFHSFREREISIFLKIICKIKLLHISVQGSPYPTRKFIDGKLKKSAARLIVEMVIRRLFQALFKVQNFIHARSSRESHLKLNEARNLQFLNQSLISSVSTFSWVDGSYLNYPVRKYIEMPLTNSIIVSPKNASLEAMGFKHLESIVFLDLNHADSELQTIKLISRNKRAEIRRKAVSLVKQNHAVEIQLSRLFEFIELYESETPMTGFLIEGKYKLLKVIKN